MVDVIGEELLEKKKYKKIADAYNDALQMQGCMRDEMGQVKDFQFEGDKGMFMLNANDSAFLTPYSLGQLGGKYGISNSYIKKCVSEGYDDLIRHNFSRWMENDEDVLLFRYFENKGVPVIRGILSTRYQRFDTTDIIEALSESWLSTWGIRQSMMNPERLHLRLVSDVPIEVPNEDLFIGVTVDSSDVGRSAVLIRAIVFKQVCTNGLVLPMSVGDLYRQVHVGAGADRFGERIAACLDTLSDFKEKAAEMIVAGTRMGLPFEIGKEEEIDRWRSRYKIPKGLVENTLNLLNEGKYAMNRWGLINSMTEAAQIMPIESRIMAERVAGELLVA